MRRTLVPEFPALVASDTGTALICAFAQHPEFGPQTHNRIAQLEHDFILRGHVALEVCDFFFQPHNAFVIHWRNPWRIFAFGQCAKILYEFFRALYAVEAARC